MGFRRTDCGSSTPDPDLARWKRTWRHDPVTNMLQGNILVVSGLMGTLEGDG